MNELRTLGLIGAVCVTGAIALAAWPIVAAIISNRLEARS